MARWAWAGVLVALVLASVVYAVSSALGVFCSEEDEHCSEKHAVLAVTVLMAGLWVVGKPHSAVVSMLPVILLPMMGVGGHKYSLENQYFNKVNFILLGSFLLAFAIEEVGLQNRVALKLLSMVPGEPKVVLLAIMGISALLSAFMSNTATASLMCPLAKSLYEEVREVNALQDEDSENVSSEETTSSQATPEEELPEDPQLRYFFKKVVLGVAYACTIGGVSTKTGTGTNLAFSSIYSNLTGGSISFGKWLIFGFPVSFIMIIAAWGLLTMVGGLGKPGYSFPTEAFRNRYAKLGRINRQEVIVAVTCLAVILGWFFRDPAWGHGYAEIFPDPHAFTDATVVLAATLPLFLIPSKEDSNTPILPWSKIAGKMPMGLFLLIGAGSALSKAFEVSGLSLQIGQQLQYAAGQLPMEVFQFFCMIIAAIMSQATSDVAVANILLPIGYGVAMSLKVHPLQVMLPMALAGSLPFMLVVSTPPNAIAFQTGFITNTDLLRFGVPLTLGGLLIMYGACTFIAFPVLGI